jgi:hypothetical protein
LLQEAWASRSIVLRSHQDGTSNNEEDDLDDDDDDDVDEIITAYGKRSVGWTTKYRKLLPYEMVRKSVIELGLRSKDEWDEYVADGKVDHGAYLPNHPDEMYAEEWVSWDEFLGKASLFSFLFEYSFLFFLSLIFVSSFD